jgi:hypothetical protein
MRTIVAAGAAFVGVAAAEAIGVVAGAGTAGCDAAGVVAAGDVGATVGVVGAIA